MKTIGPVRTEAQPPRRLMLRKEAAEYIVELDVSEFAQTEIRVEASGHEVKVQCVHERDKGSFLPLSVHEQLEESFRLPDDADLDRLRAVYRDGTLVLSTRRRPLTRRIVAVEPDVLAYTDMGS